jgi:hypothetical protein
MEVSLGGGIRRRTLWLKQRFNQLLFQYIEKKVYSSQSNTRECSECCFSSFVSSWSELSDALERTIAPYLPSSYALVKQEHVIL